MTHNSLLVQIITPSCRASRGSWGDRYIRNICYTIINLYKPVLRKYLRFR